MNNIQIAKRLNEYLEENKITEQIVAKATNTDQSHVSRIRNGKFKRITEKVKRVCSYASIELNLNEEKNDPAKNIYLMEAISEVWDGTNEKAKALARIIRSLKGLS